ncbi:MAG: hypothetical protein ACT4QA_07935 [Panacagrimonas sp.]
MDPIHHQKEANKFFEGGIFYPTGHVITAFPTAEDAGRAQEALGKAGFVGDHVMSIDARTMAREAGENLDSRGLLSVGASVPTRQKQLELAQQGCHFLLIHAPEDADHERVMRTLSDTPVRYAVKYHRLVIQNLIDGIPNTAPDAEPARVP